MKTPKGIVRSPLLWVEEEGPPMVIVGDPGQSNVLTNLIQWTEEPLSPIAPQFSVKILQMIPDPIDHFIMIGVNCRCSNGSQRWVPRRSLRYHTNTGGVFAGANGVKTHRVCRQGDTMTLLLEYSGPTVSLVMLIRNGEPLLRYWVTLPPDQLYATVGVSHGACRLAVDWPRPHSPTLSLRPEMPSHWFGFPGFEFNNAEQTITFTAKHPNEKELLAYNVQCPKHITKDRAYFEVTILKQSDEKAGIGIGLVPAVYDRFQFPGWQTASIGYHGDDGGLYLENDNKPAQTGSVDTMCRPGDTMGCGFVLPPTPHSAADRLHIWGVVFFTKNGRLVYHLKIRQPEGGLYPCIGFCTLGDKVKLQLPATPPADLPELDALLQTLNGEAEFKCHYDVKRSAYDGRLDAMLTLASDVTTPRAIQHILGPHSHVGSWFSLTPLELDEEDCEVQVGVASQSFPLEGADLGSTLASCGFHLARGTLHHGGVHQPARPVRPGDTIRVYLDYLSASRGLLCFTVNNQLVGRCPIELPPDDEVCATVALRGKSSRVKVVADWLSPEKPLINVQEEGWIHSSDIEKDGVTMRLVSLSDYVTGVTAQAIQPLRYGRSVFAVRLGGEEGVGVPSVGVCSATTYLEGPVGNEPGHLLFLPERGGITKNGGFVSLSEKRWVPKRGDVLGVGVFFVSPSEREAATVGIYLTLNGQFLFRSHLTASFGGVYPCVCFHKPGQAVTITKAEHYPNIPEVFGWISTLSRDYQAANDKAGDAPPPKEYLETVNEDQDTLNGLPEVQDEKPSKELKGKHVVISHCRADSVLAHAVSIGLVTSLQGRQQPASLILTGDLPDIAAKSQAFAKADVIVLLLSPAFYSSSDVFTEYTAFRGIGIPLVTCRLGEGEGYWPPSGLFARSARFLGRCPSCTLCFHDNQLQDATPLLQLLQAAFSPKPEEEETEVKSKTPVPESSVSTARSSNGVQDVRQPPQEPSYNASNANNANSANNANNAKNARDETKVHKQSKACSIL